jgi:hypothetical protein
VDSSLDGVVEREEGVKRVDVYSKMQLGNGDFVLSEQV